MDRPAAGLLFGDAQRALVEAVHDLADGARMPFQGRAIPLSFLHGRAQGVGRRLRQPQLFRSGILHRAAS